MRCQISRTTKKGITKLASGMNHPPIDQPGPQLRDLVSQSSVFFDARYRYTMSTTKTASMSRLSTLLTPSTMSSASLRASRREKLWKSANASSLASRLTHAPPNASDARADAPRSQVSATASPLIDRYRSVSIGMGCVGMGCIGMPTGGGAVPAGSTAGSDM